MADLDSLIRVRRHVVEQKQKFLTELYDQADALEDQKQAMIRQMAIEKAKTQELGVEMLSFFDQYVRAVKERLLDLDDAMDTLEKRIDMAREEVREAFADVKKVEIIQERRLAEEKATEEKKESDVLDEIGIETVQRENND